MVMGQINPFSILEHLTARKSGSKYFASIRTDLISKTAGANHSPLHFGSLIVIDGKKDLRQQRLPNGAGGEKFSTGGLRVGLIDHENILLADVQAALQRGDQLIQPSQLGWRRHAAIEIADQANADAIGIDLASTVRWGGRDLFVPALADLNFAVDAPFAVSDHEVIRHAERIVGPRERDGVPGRAAAVVNIDVLPSRRAGRRVGVENRVNGLRRFNRKKAVRCIRRQGRRRERQQERAGQCENRDKRAEYDDSAMGIFHVCVPRSTGRAMSASKSADRGPASDKISRASSNFPIGRVGGKS